MKLLTTITTSLLFTCGLAHSADLTVKLTDINKVKGQLYITVYDSAQAMKSGKNAWQQMIVKVTKQTHTLSFHDVPTGEYGIMVFQDLNDNQALDSNMFGIPNEPYGFSNNPSLMGPPKFTDIAFKVSDNSQTISISME